jgi:ribosomal peptide maturation radical SAM protein 1
MRVVLINMPFASLGMPSLALTQLSAVLKQRFGDAVTVETHYLNLDFARYIGEGPTYQRVFVDAGFMTGVGDWFFRQVAFPDAEDNSEAYFGRFYFADDVATDGLRQMLREKRNGLSAFMEELMATHDLASADVVGFTTLFSQTVASCAMARLLKEANPNLITCMGGAACEGGMGAAYAARIDAMDAVFSGPALVSFPAFIEACLEGRRPASGEIDGVVCGDASDVTPEGVQGEALDINTNIPLDYGPFLDAFDRAFPQREMRPVLLFETSRGCYWAEKQVCTFCGLNGLQHHYRWMTPANAIRQIQSLYRWAPRCASFIAVDTAMPRDYVSTVFPALDVPDGVKLMYEVRPDLKEDELAAMCGGGVGALQPGIESLSSASLKLMRKGTTAFSNLRFLKACSRYPLALDWNLLIHSPGESESTREKLVRDIPFLTHLAPPTGVYPIMVVRHSRYFDAPEAYGLELNPQDFYALTYPFEASVIQEIATHFVNRNADAEQVDACLVRLNEVVGQWRARWLGSDGLPQARLCLLEGEGPESVYDSRSGEELEQDLSVVAKQILVQLERPARVADVAQALVDVSADVLAREMAWLIERGWVFEEEGRYLNLVIL